LDRHFLEFWGNFLLSAATGQRQLDEFSRWLSQGLRGFPDLTAMFQQFYGLDNEGAGEDQGWKTARSSFEKAYRGYLDTLGAVSKSDYIALQQQVEALQKKTEKQDAALHQLRLELIESRMTQGDAVSGFQKLLQIQSEQFRTLTDILMGSFAGRPEKQEN